MKEPNLTALESPQSGIREIFDAANMLHDIVHLEIGQPDSPTPDHIIEAAHQAALDGFTGYSANAGLSSLRTTFAESLNKAAGLRVSPEQVVVSVGAMGALFDAFLAVIEAGDEVLVPNPGYPNYKMAITLLGGIAVPYPLALNDDGFALDGSRIEELITNKTKAIVINSPSNPTGMVATAEQVSGIVDIVQAHGLFLISDEAYDHIIFEGRHHSPLLFDKSGRTIAVYSCSKTYSMTGWRIGFVVASNEISQLLPKLHEAYCSCAPTVSQKAAEAGLAGSQQCVADMVAAYRTRVDLACTLCDEYHMAYCRPKGTFYLMIKIPEYIAISSRELALALVKKHGVAVAPGSAFGSLGENYIRLSLCCDENVIAEGLKRINRGFLALQGSAPL